MEKLVDVKYPYRVLIVEDEKNWYEDIQDAILHLPASNICSDIAATIEQAHQHIAQHRYHLISCDMKMPVKERDAVEVGHGKDFAKKTHQDGQLALFKIYSGQAMDKPDSYTRFAGAIFHLAGEIGTEVYLKSVDGKERPEQREYSAQGWAEKIKEWLEAEAYISNSVKLGEELLPSCLAGICLSLHRSWDNASLHLDHQTKWIHLYQTTLCLSWMQMAAVAYQAGVDVGSRLTKEKATDALRISDMERWLENLRKCSALLKPWRPYFMDPRDTDERDGSGQKLSQDMGAGIVATLRMWKEFRNKNAHTTGDVVQNFHETYEYSLRKLIDLIAFWAKHPLIRFFEFHDGRGNASVQFVRHHRQFVDVSLDTDERYQPGHIYVLWDKSDKGNQLLDLWPFVHEEENTKLGQRVLYCFSHAKQTPKGIQWYRRNLNTLDPEPWSATPEQARVLMALCQ